MDSPAATDPSWWFLLAGFACVALGLACLLIDGAFPAIARAVGGGPPGPREARWFPRLLLATGAVWLFVGGTEVYPFAHGERPYGVVILTVLLHPLGALGLAGALVWIVLLRRF